MRESEQPDYFFRAIHLWLKTLLFFFSVFSVPPWLILFWLWRRATLRGTLEPAWGFLQMEMQMNSDLEKTIREGKLSGDLSFEQKVWAITARIPKGKVATYGWVAKQLNCRAYRAVGRALGRNPFAPGVPCHRVVGSNGALTGFAGGLPKKRKLLLSEGIELVGDKVRLSEYAI
jgi:O-6-methylguanine DNA methyltransferase